MRCRVVRLGDQSQRAAIRQCGDVGRIGGARRETVPREVEFLDDRGPQLTRRMQARHDGTRRQRGAGQLPAGGCALLQHENFLAGLREVGSSDQAIVAGADDQDVRVRHRAYRQSLRISIAAILPAAPITPPPGCAPAAPK